MKKALTFFILIISFSQIHAQLSYGAKAAANFAKLRLVSGQNITEYKPVVYGGFFANYKLKKFAVQMDVLGFVEKDKMQNFKTGITSTNNNFVLRIPLLLQFAFAKGMRISTGPQVGFAIKKNNRSADWKWAVGAGYQLPYLKGLSVMTKYSFNLKGMQMKNFGRSVLNNSVLQLGISYSISRKVKTI